VLCPEDQVLHACAHLFQDSDLDNRLRDLIDIYELVTEFQSRENFWPTLIARARMHELTRSLWYGLRYANAWLALQVPEEVIEELKSAKPLWITATMMDSLVPAALMPHHPDNLPNLRVKTARAALLARSHWLKMPPALLARHLTVKSWRGLAATIRSARGNPA
jgi:hypothetical protein